MADDKKPEVTKELKPEEKPEVTAETKINQFRSQILYPYMGMRVVQYILINREEILKIHNLFAASAIPSGLELMLDFCVKGVEYSIPIKHLLGLSA